MRQIILGNIRVQFLSEEIVRIEYGKNTKFCDENTFFIPSRSNFGNKGADAFKNGAIVFGEYELYVPENARSLAGVCLYRGGKKVYTYKKLANSGELSPLNKTPEVFAISDTPRIIVPEGGYSVDRKGEYIIEENAEDIYLLLCKKDAKLLRKLYVELTGKPELVRLSTLGGWNSKYYAYTEEEAKQLILDYEKYNVPLDVMVIDTDWRSCEHGWGYDINTKLFPDMKRFVDFAHGHGVEIMFNDHPEPVNRTQIFSPEEIEYREKNLQSLMEKGLDIWWYDRNWSTRLIPPTESVRHETFGLYLFEDITKHYYQKAAKNKEIYRRPVIMGNVVNIINGTYADITDSASHRYSIQWTGDIDSLPNFLAQDIDNLIKCGDNAIPYMNSDCGGHLGNPTKELFIRWMQYGALSPVFRPHCTNTVERTREPWVYDEQTLDIVREYNNLRYRLLPVIYKNAYNAYETGEPIFKALGWEYPEDKKALKINDEYMLGNNILIRPIVGALFGVMEEKHFTEPVKAVYYNGRELKGEPIAKAEYKKLDINLAHVSPEEGVPVYDFSARFKTKVKFDKDKSLFLRSDDGATVWIDGVMVHEDKTTHPAMYFSLGMVQKDIEHSIEIEYFQAGGEAAIGLYCDEDCSDITEIYLPKGRWLDAFGGKIYNGGKTVRRAYGLREMPLFVRLGALIPLAYEARNTKEQKWDKLVYDFYPDKQASDKGYLYEDDTQTTAYKKGGFRKSRFAAGYCEQSHAYVVSLYKVEGSFKGEKCFAEREITFKVHLVNGENISGVTVNDKNVSFQTEKKDASVFPLNTAEATPDSDTLILKLKVRSDENYEIKFILD